jgi:hypothetical protein
MTREKQLSSKKLQVSGLGSDDCAVEALCVHRKSWARSGTASTAPLSWQLNWLTHCFMQNRRRTVTATKLRQRGDVGFHLSFISFTYKYTRVAALWYFECHVSVAPAFGAFYKQFSWKTWSKNYVGSLGVNRSTILIRGAGWIKVAVGGVQWRFLVNMPLKHESLKSLGFFWPAEWLLDS